MAKGGAMGGDEELDNARDSKQLPAGASHAKHGTSGISDFVAKDGTKRAVWPFFLSNIAFFAMPST